MRHVAFYHADSGRLHGLSVMADDDLIDTNTPPGHIAIDHPPGKMLHPSLHRVDVLTGKIIEELEPPPTPDHVWDATGLRWVLSHAAQARLDAHSTALNAIAALESTQLRAVREALLGDGGAIAKLRNIDSQIAAHRANIIKDTKP